MGVHVLWVSREGNGKQQEPMGHSGLGWDGSHVPKVSHKWKLPEGFAPVTRTLLKKVRLATCLNSAGTSDKRTKRGDELPEGTHSTQVPGET